MIQPPIFSPSTLKGGMGHLNKNYEQNLFRWLVNVKDYRLFERRVVDELGRLKIDSWSYIRLDVPTLLSIPHCLGTISKQHLDAYSAEGFYEHDLMINHLKNSSEPIFKSDIDAYVNSAPFVSEAFQRYKDLSDMNRRFKCCDSYSVPLVASGLMPVMPNSGMRTKVSEFGGAAFTVNCSGTRNSAFKELVVKNSRKLLSIGRAINDAGVVNFPEKFTGGKQDFEKLIKSQPYNLLITMVKCDLTLNQAADHLGISVNTAQKHILSIRRSLGVKTNYGAYEMALRQGLVTT